MQDENFIIERKILKIGNQLINTRNSDLNEYNLTSSQSETLLFFDRLKGARVLDLKDYLKISHQAARNIVERMKLKDLLYVETSNEDARAKQVYLTDNGQSICDALKKRGTSIGETMLIDLSSDEKRTLSNLLNKISDKI